jgi:hypothetical protein
MSVLLSDSSSDSSSSNKLTAVLQSLAIYVECAGSSTETTSLYAVLSLMSNYPEAPSMSAIIQFVQIDAVCEILQQPLTEVQKTCAWFDACLHNSVADYCVEQRLTDAATLTLMKHIFVPFSAVTLTADGRSASKFSAACTQYIFDMCEATGIVCSADSVSALGKTLYYSKALLMACCCTAALDVNCSNAIKYNFVVHGGALLSVIGLINLDRSGLLVGVVQHEISDSKTEQIVIATERAVSADISSILDSKIQLVVGAQRPVKHTTISSATPAFVSSVTQRVQVRAKFHDFNHISFTLKCVLMMHLTGSALTCTFSSQASKSVLSNKQLIACTRTKMTELNETNDKATEQLSVSFTHTSADLVTTPAAQGLVSGIVLLTTAAKQWCQMFATVCAYAKISTDELARNYIEAALQILHSADVTMQLLQSWVLKLLVLYCDNRSQQ